VAELCASIAAVGNSETLRLSQYRSRPQKSGKRKKRGEELCRFNIKACLGVRTEMLKEVVMGLFVG
jgi:hypothetical protein